MDTVISGVSITQVRGDEMFAEPQRIISALEADGPHKGGGRLVQADTETARAARWRLGCAERQAFALKGYGPGNDGP
jgi:hypothetical protein